MSAIETELWKALQALEAAARGGSGHSEGQSLRALFARIEDLAGRLPPEGDRELRHYLERKSYTKARAHLEAKAGARRLTGTIESAEGHG